MYIYILIYKKYIYIYVYSETILSFFEEKMIVYVHDIGFYQDGL